MLGELLTVRLLGPAGRERAMLPLAAVTLIVPVGFVMQPSLLVAGLLLLLSTAGYEYTLGLDQLLLAATPPPLRRRVLSVSTSGLMFWQGLGFALTGAAAEIVPIRAAIPLMSVIGLLGLMRLAAGLRSTRTTSSS